MKLSDINISETLKNAKQALKKEENISPSFKALIELLILIISLLLQKLNINSSNSSTPPSADPNRKKKSKTKPYEFYLWQNDSEKQNLEPNKFYLRLEDESIVYQCIDPKGNITQGRISQKDLPAGVQIPERNDLDSFNAIRKSILKITQERGDTELLIE